MLRGVTLSVEAGEFVAVMGPSGCGKSTLLHLAGALETPSAGSIRVAGRELAGLDAGGRSELRRHDVGFVFQRLNLIPALTAIENVMLPLELAGDDARDARPLAIEALEAMGLDEQLDRYPDDFSGGQQQRIAIARAVVGERQLLLADEPTGSLDTASGDEVIELHRRAPRAPRHRGRARDPRTAVRVVGRSRRLPARRPHRRRDAGRRGCGADDSDDARDAVRRSRRREWPGGAGGAGTSRRDSRGARSDAVGVARCSS